MSKRTSTKPAVKNTPAAKRTAKTTREPKRRRIDDLTDMLHDESDRYGEKFMARFAPDEGSTLGQCVGCTGWFPRVGVKMPCGHEFWSCGDRDCNWVFQLLRSSHRDCLFCYRRFMDQICARLGIELKTPLKDDNHAESDIRAFFATEKLMT